MRTGHKASVARLAYSDLPACASRLILACNLRRRGIPPNLRPWVWMEMSTANKKKAAHAANYYSIMVKAAETSPFKEEIEQAR